MIKTIANKINLNTWIKIKLDKVNDCYLIAIKNQNKKLGDFEKDLTKISFKLGLESGIKDNPIIIDSFTLNFLDQTSDNESVDKITAFKRLLNIPNEFYIKAFKAEQNEAITNEGSLNVTLNINELDLGN